MAYIAQQKTQKSTIIIKCACIILLAVCCGLSMLFKTDIEKELRIGNYTAYNSNSVNVVTDGLLSVHYIDVGQGDSTFVSLPDGKTMLIDAGPSASKSNLISYLKDDVKIEKINYLILTHADNDHCGGMAEVLKNFEVENIYRPFQLACVAEIDDKGNTYASEPILEEDLKYYFVDTSSGNDNITGQVTTREYVEFIKLAYNETYIDDNGQTQKAKVTVCHEGLKIEGSDDNEPYLIEFFAPEQSGENYLYGALCTLGVPVVYSNSNNISPIILLEYADKSFLWTGDCESDAESKFLQKIYENLITLLRITDVTVYKAGHHGSATSSSAEFLKVINPEYTIVSCNAEGFPDEDFIKRWEKQMASQGNNRVQIDLLRTDKNGTIIFGINKDHNLNFCYDVEPSGIVVYWGYYALAIFIVGTIIIFCFKPYNPIKRRLNKAKEIDTKF